MYRCSSIFFFSPLERKKRRSSNLNKEMDLIRDVQKKKKEQILETCQLIDMIPLTFLQASIDLIRKDELHIF